MYYEQLCKPLCLNKVIKNFKVNSVRFINLLVNKRGNMEDEGGLGGEGGEGKRGGKREDWSGTTFLPGSLLQDSAQKVRGRKEFLEAAAGRCLPPHSPTL